MSILPKLIQHNTDFNPRRIFSYINKMFLKKKSVQKSKGAIQAKIILTKKKKVGDPTLPDIKTYYKTIILRTCDIGEKLNT